ncbi:MAG TPA: prolyl oligopeptidase family serine peptidase [Terracidiphilus sp.]|nr:prolyl oligopeptidase family serine peptidase [Terracidiphilus sp.]
MFRLTRFLSVFAVLSLVPLSSSAATSRQAQREPPQETGFLNRRIELNGASYRFQVYLPEEWRRDDGKLWPIILFLHGRGERGSEGMWQTQIGLPAQVRDHPERWPFVIVMPQCPLPDHWTDPKMLDLAMAALDEETAEFHGDPDRTYLTGLSMGGYGAWELARLRPRRWAAVAIAAGGIFWSYDPERWQEVSTLPATYAQAVNHTPLWLFHGSDDNVVSPRQSELLFEALKTAGGHVRLWIYQGYGHDCWTRAYNEPELPRWLLSHKLTAKPELLPAAAERTVIPHHPATIKLTPALLDSLAGEYREPNGQGVMTIYHQGDALFEKDQYGSTIPLAAESPAALFFPNGSSLVRLLVERDPHGRITALVFHDDRHEERWERLGAGPLRPALALRH